MGMWWRLSLLGALGALSMVLFPVETFGTAPVDPALLRLLAVVQPTILVMLAAALGLWAAPRVGLEAPATRAWAEGRPIWPALRPQLAPALPVGVAVALLLVGFWSIIRVQPFAAPLLAFELPLATKLLYGGIVEEILLRWGLMSLLVWVVWRAAGRPASVPGWAYWTGIAAAALLFAVGHLPALHYLVPDPPARLVALAVGANFLPGLLFGWLFYRRGLEAAMIAHASAHLFAAIASAAIH